MIDLLLLITMQCAPLGNGLPSALAYETVHDCSKRAWSCLEYGRKSYSPEQIEKCLVNGHPEREPK